MKVSNSILIHFTTVIVLSWSNSYIYKNNYTYSSTRCFIALNYKINNNVLTIINIKIKYVT